MNPLDFERIVAGARTTGRDLADAVIDETAVAYLGDLPSASMTEFSYHGARFLFDATEGMDRTVLAIGTPSIVDRSREASYQRAFPIADTCAGRPLDRGHLLPHTAGGGYGPNLFAQDRALNRGWSADGREYRRMERLAVAAPPGTFLAVVLIYIDRSALPGFVQLAILGPDGGESRLFRNRFDVVDDADRLTAELNAATDAQLGALGEEATAVFVEENLGAILVALGDAGMPRTEGRQDLDLAVIVDDELTALEVKTRYRSALAGRLTRAGNLRRPRLRRTQHGGRQASQSYVADRIGGIVDTADGYHGVRVQIVVIDLVLMLIQFFDVTDDGRRLAPSAPPTPCETSVEVALARIHAHRGRL
ncbi:hypothetical protein [Microbacterium sp. VKM Ac-2923]|uniref:hypothetical protein n=1 Tax=Microbacterium sp. VKM Ac-2923 TaxID=2929476 RepID=UPI001FB2D49D|nr:hypothetical protein [Microbacterium sp. VKM Ac-2923]MCJ1707517.1 hypothetical protein [Microbacterium sp. VKM Ac-2923]